MYAFPAVAIIVECEILWNQMFELPPQRWISGGFFPYIGIYDTQSDLLADSSAHEMLMRI